MFSTLDRYIFKQTFFSFIGGAFLLTLVVWATQVLREVDLITNKGQSTLLFVQIAAYLFPMLILVIAPIALFVGIMQTLNKLSGDSELIVMTAAGVSPFRILRPFLFCSIIAAGLVAVLSLWYAPASIRNLRILGNQAQSNIISVVVKPGRFTDIQAGLVFHIRERLAGGILSGLLISDTRDKGMQLTYIAEKGLITEITQGSFLILESGTLQRRNMETGEITIVAFDKYAFDLTSLSSGGQVAFRPSERTLHELQNPDPNDFFYKSAPGRYKQELHDRISAIIYPFVYLMIAIAYMGHASTTRSSRTGAMISAALMLGLTKGLSLALSSAAAGNASLVIYVYLFPLIMTLFFAGAALGFYRLLSFEEFVQRVAFYARKTPLRLLLDRKKVTA